MKKFFAVLLAACMVAGTAVAFAGCGDDDMLRVATNAAFPPFEYKQGKAFTGVDMQIAKLLADDMGKTLEIVDMEFDSVINSVKSGDCAIGMAGMTVTETRKEQVDFTDEYYESAQVMIYKTGDTRFAGIDKEGVTAEEMETFLSEQTDFTVGTQNGTTGYMYSHGDEGMGYDGYSNIETLGYTTGAAAARDIIEGKVDAVIIDRQPALMIAESVGGLTVIDCALTSEAYAFAVRKGDTETLNAANALLDELEENGELDKIINSFFDGTATFTYTNP